MCLPEKTPEISKFGQSVQAVQGACKLKIPARAGVEAAHRSGVGRQGEHLWGPRQGVLILLQRA